MAAARFLAPGDLGAVLLLAMLLGVAGCAGLVPLEGSTREAPAPTYRVGDRWVYQAQDGFLRKDRWTETHEVVALRADAVVVRIVRREDRTETQRTEEWTATGEMRSGALFDRENRRFATPLRRYAFPLRPGSTWNQFVINVNDETGMRGEVNRYVAVGGWGKVATPAGTFDAIRLRVVMNLDDDTFWRWPTRCDYVVWYAPEARAMVREERDAEYIEKTDVDPARVRTQHALLELVSFTRGAPP